MPRDIDLTRLRYYASLGLIAIGTAMLLYVAAGWVGLRGSDGAPVQALRKAGPEACPPDWRYIDNVDQRFTVCVPRNLVASAGDGVLLLEDATAADWARIFADFVLVNDAGLSFASTDTDSAPLAPISLRIDVVPPGTSIGGCDPRSQLADAGGVAVCSDTFNLDQGEMVFTPDGRLHRFQALAPTLKGRSVNDAFSLYLSIVSLTEDWGLQEPLFRELLPTLRPY